MPEAGLTSPHLSDEKDLELLLGPQEFLPLCSPPADPRIQWNPSLSPLAFQFKPFVKCSLIGGVGFYPDQNVAGSDDSVAQDLPLSISCSSEIGGPPCLVAHSSVYIAILDCVIHLAFLGRLPKRGARSP